MLDRGGCTDGRHGEGRLPLRRRAVRGDAADARLLSLPLLDLPPLLRSRLRNSALSTANPSGTSAGMTVPRGCGSETICRDLTGELTAARSDSEGPRRPTSLRTLRLQGRARESA